MGLPRLAERVQHRDLPPRVSIRRRDPRDGLPAQRHAELADSADDSPSRSCGARDSGRDAHRPLRAHLEGQPGRRARLAAILAGTRRRADGRAARRRHGPPSAPASPADAGARRGAGCIRPQRLRLSGHPRSLSRRGRTDHGLLVRDVRLRRHRQADRVLHIRPRGIPRRRARFLLRPRGGGAGADMPDERRRDRRAHRPRRRIRALRPLPAALLPARRRRRRARAWSSACSASRRPPAGSRRGRRSGRP